MKPLSAPEGGTRALPSVPAGLIFDRGASVGYVFFSEDGEAPDFLAIRKAMTGAALRVRAPRPLVQPEKA